MAIKIMNALERKEKIKSDFDKMVKEEKERILKNEGGRSKNIDYYPPLKRG